ncbi:hypothetical protein [Echinimonas agarilytica]|uniref:Zinc-regulated TonB-dependent outer membrane receptor n=1 Tax=Echinimonas agarilytica TaxID=1215918 RepID=A0AA42B6C4_9GAMM|nr:hypothetical protein [Echinimonas agarilytica]MCM2678443.1 hypothetical protein [Echinimonas agarilytica]
MLKRISAMVALALAAPVQAQTETPAFAGLNISAILNGGFTSRDHDFEGIGGLPIDGDHSAGPEDGFWLDHTELAVSGNVDDMFYGKVTTVLEEHDGSTEVELEEAFVQTLAMPAGFSIRAGRFLSNVGYLNSKHAHTDYFADRPIAYRGTLGTHYFDDGVRLNWIAPTDMYLELGAEVFKGGQFPASSGDTVGSSVVYTKLGDDINDSLSWQAGLSWLRTDNDPDHCSSHSHDDHDDHEGEDHEGEDHEGEEHDHEEHGGPGFCEFKGEKDFYVADFVMKWAPGGNYKYQHLTWQSEVIRVEEDGDVFHEDEDEWDEFSADNTAWYSSLVYQWSPNWSAGVRYSQIKVDNAYDDEGFKPKAYDAMLQYQFSHFSTLRVQYTRDESMEDLDDNVFTLQYTMAIGDHGAHAF